MSRILIDLPEIINTPKLRLQMPKAGFGRDLYEAIVDGYEDYTKWLNWSDDIPTMESVEIDCRKHHSEFILRDFIRYLIIDKATGRIVGRTAFPSFQTDWLIPQFGISYFIRRSERTKGYATAAVHVMAMLAFKMLNAKKLEIHCDAENIASNIVPLKVGFKLECTKKGGWPRQDGKLADLNTYSIFSETELPKLEVEWG